MTRELHTKLAAQAIDYEVYPEYKTEAVAKSSTVDELLNTPYFSIKVIQTTSRQHRNMIKYDSFVILMNIGTTPCTIRTRVTNEAIMLPADTSCLMPAAIADYDIIGKAKILEAFINNKKSIGTMVRDFFHIS